MLQIKRVYEPFATSDGYRILVDRIWPRGISKEKARLGLWLKDIGPSNELREWFGHEDKKWEEFRSRYKKELHSKKELLKSIRETEKKYKTVTLLYGAKNSIYNQAVVLKEVLS